MPASVDPGVEWEPMETPYANASGARFDGAAGVQLGSGNFQVNNFYNGPPSASGGSAPLTLASGSRAPLSRGHAFISYVREDSSEVDRLQNALEAAGIRVWRDTADLWPGEDWRAKIRDAITDDALVFIACFSSNSVARQKSYQNEELALAIEQSRLRRPGDPWLMPVRFDNCDVPDLELGAGRTLASIQQADLFGPNRDLATQRLVTAVQRLLQPVTPAGRRDAGGGATTQQSRDTEVRLSGATAARGLQPVDPPLNADALARPELAVALLQLGEFQAAAAVLTNVLRIDGGNSEALRLRGEILADLGAASNAMLDLDLARQLAQDHPSALAARGLALAQLGDYRRANQDIYEALKGAPGNGLVLLFVARALALMGDEHSSRLLAMRASGATDPPLSSQHRLIALSLAEHR